jgi:hypothetical protein
MTGACLKVRDASAHHLVVSVLQGRNLVPPTATGAQVSKFAPYVVASYGGVERRTPAVAGPSGSAAWDSHLVFPARATPQPLLLLLFAASASGVGADRCVGKLQVIVPGVWDPASRPTAAGDARAASASVERNRHRRSSSDCRSHSRSRSRSPVGERDGCGPSDSPLDAPLCHAEWFRLAPATQAEQDALASR